MDILKMKEDHETMLNDFHADIYKKDINWASKYLRVISNSGCESYAIVRGGEILCLGEVHIDSKIRAHIIGIYTKKSYRNIGLGTAFVRELKKIVVNDGIKQIYTNTGSEASKRFYQREKLVPTKRFYSCVFRTESEPKPKSIFSSSINAVRDEVLSLEPVTYPLLPTRYFIESMDESISSGYRSLNLKSIHYSIFASNSLFLIKNANCVFLYAFKKDLFKDEGFYIFANANSLALNTGLKSFIVVLSEEQYSKIKHIKVHGVSQMEQLAVEL